MISPAKLKEADSEDLSAFQQFPDLLNYSNFLKPLTDRVFQFKSRRFDFCRRKSHAQKMLLIIHFEGVIGNINKKSLTDENFQLVLRHGAVEGLKELIQNFQVALFSFLSEKSLKMAVEHLLRVEGICFDAIYTRV